MDSLYALMEIDSGRDYVLTVGSFDDVSVQATLVWGRGTLFLRRLDTQEDRLLTDTRTPSCEGCGGTFCPVCTGSEAQRQSVDSSYRVLGWNRNGPTPHRVKVFDAS